VGTPAKGQVHADNAVGALAVDAHAGGAMAATPPRARLTASAEEGGAEPLSRPSNANHATAGGHAGDKAGDKEDNQDSREDVADRRTMPTTIDRWLGAGQGWPEVLWTGKLPVDNGRPRLSSSEA
jgi:hypothetical protein